MQRNVRGCFIRPSDFLTSFEWSVNTKCFCCCRIFLEIKRHGWLLVYLLSFICILYRFNPNWFERRYDRPLADTERTRWLSLLLQVQITSPVMHGFRFNSYLKVRGIY